MSAEHQILERQNQRLEPQNQRMQKRQRVHDVKREGMKKTSVFRHDGVVIVGIGVGDAAASRSDAFEATLKQRLKSHEQRARASYLLRVKELLPATELARGDVVLHGRDHQGNDRERP